MSVETLNSMPAQAIGAATLPSFLASGSVLVDVRSPGEFEQGHIPGAINLPLFLDEQRAEVGTIYKRSGRQQAVLTGLHLLGERLGDLAETLLALSRSSPGPLRLCCWRGGMRSGSVAWLAGTLGLETQLLDGGYKAFRRWVLGLVDEPWPLLLLGGRTGTGKTDVLLALQQRGAAIVDLEGLAHHRGSSFGGLGLPPQPSSEQFENRIAIALWQQRQAASIWLEAESAQVGRCRIPNGLWQQMKQAPVIELVRSADARVERLVDVYGGQGQTALQDATARISRRLGPQRTALALEAIAAGDMATACRQMLEYYDRCYDHEQHQRGAPPLLSLVAAARSDDDLAAELQRWQCAHKASNPTEGQA